MSLMNKLLKVSDTAQILSDTDFFNDKSKLSTTIWPFNIAYGGSLHGGIGYGITMLAGESKTFKSLVSLLTAKAYLDADKNNVVVFLDSEFGTRPDYFEAVGIDTKRVIWEPISNIEDLKTKSVNYLESVDDNEHVFIIVDSLGLLPSVQELKIARESKTTADMTRARSLTSFFRMVTPLSNIKQSYMFVINHTYETMSMFPKTVIKGGKSAELAPNTILLTGRRKNSDEVDDKKLKTKGGFEFYLKIHKSRDVKEGSVIPYQVTYDGGFNMERIALEIAINVEYITPVKKGSSKYTIGNDDTEYTKKAILKDIFNLIDNDELDKLVQRKFKNPNTKLIDGEGEENG